MGTQGGRHPVGPLAVIHGQGIVLGGDDLRRLRRTRSLGLGLHNALDGIDGMASQPLVEAADVDPE